VTALVLAKLQQEAFGQMCEKEDNEFETFGNWRLSMIRNCPSWLPEL